MTYPLRTSRLRSLTGLALLCAAAVSFASCSEPIGPEDDIDPPVECTGCIAKTFDLRVDTVMIASPIMRDSVRRRDVVAPENLRLAIMITNMGDTASGPVQISWQQAHDTIAPIAGHEQVTHTIDVAVDSFRLSPYFAAVQNTFFVHIASPGEVNALVGGGRNSARSPAVFYSKATLQVSFARQTGFTPRLNTPFAGPFTIRNVGYRSSSAATIVGCLEDRWASQCHVSNWSAFGHYDIPSVEPGEAAVFEDSVVIPQTAAWQDETYEYELTFCAPSSNPEFGASAPCMYAGMLRLRPDYAGCSPPVLVSGLQYSYATYNCGLHPGVAGSTSPLVHHAFHLAAVDAEPGRSYTISRSGESVPIRVYDSDGLHIDDKDPAADSFSVTTAGRYYVVMYGRNAALTVTMVKQ